MAHFRGTVHNGRSKNPASLLGTAKLGLVTTCNGWECGITVEALVDGDVDGVDTFVVRITGGSNDTREREVGRFTRQDFDSRC